MQIYFFTNYRHTCVLPNHQFYFYILAVSSALLCIYILCNLYNLVSKKAKYASKLFPRRSIDVELLNISEYFFLKIVRQVPLHKSFANLLQIGKGPYSNKDRFLFTNFFAGVDNLASDGSNVSHHTQVQVSKAKWDATGMMHLGGNQERYLDEMPTIF